jgi:N-acetylglutamate synthase-like GNAT family acetyltransferase
MLIRQAVSEDAIPIQILLEQLGYTLTLEQVSDRIAAFNREHQRLVVAEKDNALVGCIGFGCYEHLVFPGRCCNIDTLIIEQNHRGMGIGTVLVQHAENYARENKCVTVELVTPNHRKDSGTHKFYQGLGFKTHDEQDYTYLAKKI